MTYSILGRDGRGSVGVAVQSKFPGVGSIVCHVRAGAGAVATQAFANPLHGRRGLELLGHGASAGETIAILLRSDEAREQRQLAVLPAEGGPEVHTGSGILGWAGEAGAHIGGDCVAAGNSLADANVPAAMVDAFEGAEGDLAGRLVVALAAGQAAGGEMRGVQSSALVIESEGAGYQGSGARLVDISVYDHPDPIGELARCLKLHRLSYFPSRPDDLVRIDDATARQLRRLLVELGYAPGREGGWSSADISAMARFMGTENFDNRIREDDLVDIEVLQEVENRYPSLAHGLVRRV